MKLQLVNLVFLERSGFTLLREDGIFLPCLFNIFLRAYPTRKPLSMELVWEAVRLTFPFSSISPK